MVSLFVLALLALATSAAAESERPLISSIELSSEEREWLDEHRRIRAYYESWPPFLLQKNGRERGITVDYLELICGELDVEVDWVHIEWSKALSEIRQKRTVDVLPILTHNEERESFLAFTRDYVSFPIVIFTRRQASFFAGGLDDLRGRTIVVERDYAMHGRLTNRHPEQKLLIVNTTEGALQKVATGSADAYIGNLAVASYIIQERGLSNLKVSAPGPFGTHNQAMGVRQDWPILAGLLDKGLDSITAAGHNDIRQRWLSVRYEHGIRPLEVVTWALGIGGGAGLLLVIIMLWNRRLSREVTERRRAERALASSRSQLLEAQTLSKIGSWSHVLKGGKLSWSEETFRIFGREPESGEPRFDEIEELIHPEDWKTLNTMHRAARKLGDRYETEIRIQREDGTVRIAAIRGGPIASEARLENEEPRVLIGTVQDITERRMIDADQRRLREQLRRSQKLESLGVLAGGIAHDFNNILAAIMGNAEMARLDQKAGKDDLDEYLDEISIASRKAAGLCDQMLAYSGQTNYSMEPIQLTSLVEEMADMLTSIVSKKATIRFELPHDLPLIMADPVQMRQIIINLATNASEALKNEAGLITITASARECDSEVLSKTQGAGDVFPGDFVVLEVRDDGQGMGDTTQLRIFEPFFSTKFAGRGLGMAAVLGIVRSHHGAISVLSTPDKGSTISLFFPALDDDAVEVSPVPEELPSTSEETTPLILVVDDEPQVLAAINRLLSREGYEILSARNGREAIELFKEKKDALSCVLLDLIMPELDGKESFEKFQAIDDRVPVIMMSGYNRDELERRFVGNRRPVGFIHKPFNLETLTTAVRRGARKTD